MTCMQGAYNETQQQQLTAGDMEALQHAVAQHLIDQLANKPECCVQTRQTLTTRCR
jgi:hypothetical protein